MTEGALAPAEAWLAARGWRPFAFQREVWAAYLRGESGLVHATTGAGKTYAAWLGPVAEALRDDGGRAPAGLAALWVTPLRALAADTAQALAAPLRDLGLPWAVETRTGDTPDSVRARQRRRLPAALVTTPESLSLLLARPDAAALFAGLRCVVVDEWHELLASKRGVQVELALARLRRWRPGLRAWGLSATLGNLDAALEALVGAGGRGLVVRGDVPKPVTIDALIPATVERFPWAGHLGLRMLDQVLAEVETARSCLVFTNTRAQTELWYQAMLEARPEWAGLIALHHGSLGREVREWVEGGLRDGRLRCVVCTSSLDLGVDFSPVERVLQVGSPKGVARLLQRAVRSGHQPGAPSRVTGGPTHALELVEVAAVRRAALAGRIEARPPLSKPLDVLAQHLVTVALGGGFRADELLAEVRSARAYAGLSDEEWRWCLDFVTRGGAALTAYPEFSRVAEEGGLYTVADAAVARRHRQAIGTITADAAMVVQYLGGERLGTVEEAFIARLSPGERFTFAGRVLEFVRVKEMTAWVRRARGAEGAVPRWTGGRLPLSSELAAAVRERLEDARDGLFEDPELEALRPILALQARWSRIPAADELLAERVKTRDGHHLFLYPFEGRLVHEGLAALLAHRLARRGPITFTVAANDYGLELLAAEPAPLGIGGADPAEDLRALLDPAGLADDILAALNAAELARRQFREIARVAGLVVTGPPHERRSARQLQASSNLFYDVFAQYDPENLLREQARREVLERQLERGRLAAALARLASSAIALTAPPRPTPLAFPLLVDRLRERVSSEELADRVRRMQLQLERAAG
ncbi:MAG TPA: ligase-associated DNA damage response DEXH box helicase [Chloroflexaceae bacterium]|nr:ligase-associated DNA damage response DEXH box helicase [Chloroflexaceae bacterium]